MTSTSATALQTLWDLLDLPRAPESAPRRQTRTGSGRAAALAPSSFAAGFYFSPGQAYGIVKKGIPSRALNPLSEYLGLGKGAVVGYLDMDRATATRKEAKDEMLPTHAAESLLRLLELDSLAKETFETPEEAAAWMRKPHPMLDGETPLQCAKSGFGAQRVKDILVAIKYGGVV